MKKGKLWRIRLCKECSKCNKSYTLVDGGCVKSADYYSKTLNVIRIGYKLNLIACIYMKMKNDHKS